MISTSFPEQVLKINHLQDFKEMVGGGSKSIFSYFPKVKQIGFIFHNTDNTLRLFDLLISLLARKVDCGQTFRTRKHRGVLARDGSRDFEKGGRSMPATMIGR